MVFHGFSGVVRFCRFVHTTALRRGQARRSVPRWRRISQISFANCDRRSGGVARIISTAAAVSIASDLPFMDKTAVSH